MCLGQKREEGTVYHDAKVCCALAGCMLHYSLNTLNAWEKNGLFVHYVFTFDFTSIIFGIKNPKKNAAIKYDKNSKKIWKK